MLDNKAVDTISGEIQSKMKSYGVQKANIERARLGLEELLFNIASHFECRKEVTVVWGKRFGERYIIIRYEGESYNPMEDIASTGFSEMLLDRLSLKPILFCIIFAYLLLFSYLIIVSLRLNRSNAWGIWYTCLIYCSGRHNNHVLRFLHDSQQYQYTAPGADTSGFALEKAG